MNYQHRAAPVVKLRMLEVMTKAWGYSVCVITGGGWVKGWDYYHSNMINIIYRITSNIMNVGVLRLTYYVQKPMIIGATCRHFYYVTINTFTRGRESAAKNLPCNPTKWFWNKCIRNCLLCVRWENPSLCKSKHE